jgi:hypothetical protein
MLTDIYGRSIVFIIHDSETKRKKIMNIFKPWLQNWQVFKFPSVFTIEITGASELIQFSIVDTNLS